MSAIIRFEYGTLAPHELWEAAQAVSDAFAAKHAALGVPAQAAIEVLARAIDPGSAVFAYQGEAFAGVAGLVTPSRRFLRLGLAQALRHLGPGRGLVYYLVARADSRVAEGEVKVQALAVRRGMRCQGIGRGLLSHVETLARDWAGIPTRRCWRGGGRRGGRVWRTDEYGDVEFVRDGEMLWVQRGRLESCRGWQMP